MEKKDLGQTSTKIEANVAACLSYLLGFVSGIVFFLIEKENKFVRFHAMQAIIVFGTLTVIPILLAIIAPWMPAVAPIFGVLVLLLSLTSIILWIVLMVKAYQGEKFALPIAGDIAEKNS